MNRGAALGTLLRMRAGLWVGCAAAAWVGCSAILPYDFGRDGALPDGGDADAGPGPVEAGTRDAGVDGGPGVDAGPPCTSCPDGQACFGARCADVRALAAGDDFSCALGSTNEVRCWGHNDVGQLGDDGPSGAARAVGLPPGAVTAIDAHGQTACAVVEGEVHCWGQTAHLAANGTRPPAGVRDVVSLAVGRTHVCAVTDASLVFCWGPSDEGEAGVATVPAPRQVATTGSTQRIAAGDAFTCIHGLPDGVQCWGAAANARLGSASFSGGPDPQAAVLTGLGVPSALVAGARHACAVFADDLYCWGDNENDQLGNGMSGASFDADASRASPVATATPVELSAGDGHTCVRASDDRVYCAGDNDTRQLGLAGGITNVFQIPVELTRAGHVASGARHNVAVGEGGAVLGWGDDGHGQLGGDDVSIAPTSVNVTASTIGVGPFHSCAGTQPTCWGRGDRGQIGDSLRLRRASPRDVFGPSMVRPVVVGTLHACGLATDRVHCWGVGANGRLGSGNSNDQTIATVMQPMLSGEMIASVAAGLDHTCLVTVDGSSAYARCVGNNASGQLGLARSISEQDTAALRVSLAGTPGGEVEIRAGDEFSCARVGGTVSCWGRSDRGQTGAIGMGAAPVTQVRLAVASRRLFAGPAAACSLGLSGELECWGDGEAFGALGPVAAPVTVATPAGAIEHVALGPRQLCVVVGGRLHCRGDNRERQIAPAGPNDVADLAAVPDLVGLAEVEIGAEHSCAIREPDGTVLCWGYDLDGRVGTGRLLEHTTPRRSRL